MDLAEKMERLDVVDIIEKEIGKPVSEFTEDEIKVFLKKAMQMNGIRSAVQEAIPDTNMGTPFETAIRLITEAGFELAYKNTRTSGKNGWTDTDCIFVSRDGLVIYIESYRTMVNSFSLMGEVFVTHNMSDGYSLMDRICCGGGSFGYFKIEDDESNEPLKAYISADCRTGFIRKLNLLRELGTPIPQWQDKNRFIWLLNYDEERIENYRELSLNKIRNSDNLILKRIFHQYL